MAQYGKQAVRITSHGMPSLVPLNMNVADHRKGTLPTLPVRSPTRWDGLYFQRVASCFLVRTANGPADPCLTFNSLDTPLAMGFDILQGRQEITVPANTEPGTDYAVVRKSTIPILGILYLSDNQCSVTLAIAVKLLPSLPHRTPILSDKPKRLP